MTSLLSMNAKMLKLIWMLLKRLKLKSLNLLQQGKYLNKPVYQQDRTTQEKPISKLEKRSLRLDKLPHRYHQKMLERKQRPSMNEIMELDLSIEQMNEAFNCLALGYRPPKELQHLKLREWEALSELLNNLMEERHLVEQMGLLH